MKVRIATRQSALALWQAHHVANCLKQHFSNINITLVPLITTGDKTLDTDLSKIGGKGVFVKELEHALLSHEADMAVHSLKDMPSILPEGLTLAAIGQRESVEDVLVTEAGLHWQDLPQGALIGTSSLRRSIQFKALRPDCVIRLLRGNVPTRLQKWHHEGLTGILLARAGLIRLNLSTSTPHTVLSIEDMLPAVGQGAIAVECREQDTFLLTMVQQAFHHEPTSVCIQAERALNLALGGSCQVPVAGLAVLIKGMIQLKARVGCLDGCSYLSAQTIGYAEEAELLGKSVAELLRNQGAGDVIETVRQRGFFA